MGTTYGTRRGRLAVGVAPLPPAMLLVGLWLAGAAESASPTETRRATYAEANAIITALMTGQPPIDSFDALFIGNRLTAIGTLFSKAFDFRAAAERTPWCSVEGPYHRRAEGFHRSLRQLRPTPLHVLARLGGGGRQRDRSHGRSLPR
jgi:hypothetical protein